MAQVPNIPQRRRDEVDEAARRVIVRKGLKATTLRDISREGGFTTGVLTHYFPDKEALIFGVFAGTSERWIARVRALFGAQKTAQDLLCAVVELIIPGTEEERSEWRLWVEMWSYAAGNPRFAEYVVAVDALWEAELRTVLERGVAARILPTKLDVAAQARVLARLIDGIGVRGLLNGRWDGARAILIEHLASLGLPPRVIRRLNEHQR